MALTKKQQKFYDSLLTFFRKRMRMPTHREAARLNSLKSANSSVQYHRILVEKNYLKQDKQGNYIFSSALEAWPGAAETGSSIPVLGEITAGSMQEAVGADLGELTFSHLFPAAQNIFALRVKGMSMKQMGITDGDFVLLSKTELRDGEVGAVLYNGETTLKKIYQQDDELRLQPANPDFDEIVIETGEFEEVTIVGKYLGHINDKGLIKSPY